jgi:3'(2'), 5'-bisphosphate nucleotidase
MTRARHDSLTPALRDTLLELCRQSAAVIREFYEAPGTPARLRSKDDDSPLTRADLASHRILTEGLQTATPDWPVLSEESPAAAIADRHRWSTFWMIDPLDGTREFLEGTGEFTINVALIDAQRSVAGVIYQPLAGRAFLGIVGEGAYLLQPAGDGWSREPIITRSANGDALTLLASRRHRNARLASTVDFLEQRYSLVRSNSGSALKFCDLASGRGDVYPRFSPCSEWDVAAGDALVTAAGGAVFGLDGAPLRYNARDTLLAEPFLAVGDPAQPVWQELLSVIGGTGAR